jgi:outer membrane immunogenic protein
MRRLLLASVTLLALAGTESARAADLPPGAVYPAVAPRFTFTGFYVGGTIGGAQGGSKYLETPGGAFGIAAASVAAVGTSSTSPSGVIGGLEAGYNWQFGMFVVGFETDFSGWDMSSNSGVPGNPLILGGFPSSTASVNSNWLFTRVRVWASPTAIC